MPSGIFLLTVTVAVTLADCADGTTRLSNLSTRMLSLTSYNSVLKLLPSILLGAGTWWNGAAAGETWYLIEFDGEPVGYELVRKDVDPDSQNRLVHCFRRTRLKLRRLGGDLTLQADLSTTQTATGILQEFNLNRVDAAGARIQRRGSWDADKRAYLVKERVAVSRREYLLRSAEPVYSPMISTWLPGQMHGKQRSGSWAVLFPESGRTAAISAQLKSPRQRRIHGDRVTVSELRFHPQLAPDKSTQLFISEDNRTVLQQKQILGGELTMRPVNASEAIAAVSGKSLNLDLLSVIPISHVLSNSATRKQLTLALTVKSGFLPDIPTSATQKTVRQSGSTIHVSLQRLIPPSDLDGQLQRTDPLPSTRWMPSEDVSVRRIAGSALASDRNPYQLCRTLERLVAERIRTAPFSASITPVSEILKTQRGDCTEYALLLATLIRSRGIQSRIASGLIYSPRHYGFVGHTWVEANMGKTWLPFDAAISGGCSGLQHIKLGDSTMPDDDTGIGLFLPVLELTGRATVDLTE